MSSKGLCPPFLKPRNGEAVWTTATHAIRARRVLPFYSTSTRSEEEVAADTTMFGGVDRTVYSNLAKSPVKIGSTMTVDGKVAFLHSRLVGQVVPSTENFFQAAKYVDSL